MAQAANEFLDILLASPATATPEPDTAVSVEPITPAGIPGGISDEEEEELLLRTNLWVLEQGLPEGELLYELADEETGEVLALLDLAWPEGIQTGLSDPVALLIDEGRETLEAASEQGFRCFTDLETFKDYVIQEILALEPAY